MISINSVSDHVHAFFGMRPIQSLSDLMQDIKGDSPGWINKKRFLRFRFEWQQRYGAFSYCRDEVSKVASYIEYQQQHHKGEKFLDEYRRMLTTIVHELAVQSFDQRTVGGIRRQRHKASPPSRESGHRAPGGFAHHPAGTVPFNDLPDQAPPAGIVRR